MQQLPEYLIEYLLDRGLDRHSLPYRDLMASTISHVENAMKRDIERGLYIPPQENINAKYFLRRRQYNPLLSNEINEYLLETKGNLFFYNDKMLLSDEDALPIREKMNEDIKAGRYKPTDLSSVSSHVFDDTINAVYANPLFSDNVNEYIIKGKDKYYNNPIAWRYEPNARALEERVQELIDKGEFIPQGLDSKYLKPLTVRTTNPISNNIQSAQELLNNIDEAIGNNSNITNPNMVDNKIIDHRAFEYHNGYNTPFYLYTTNKDKPAIRTNITLDRNSPEFQIALEEFRKYLAGVEEARKDPVFQAFNKNTEEQMLYDFGYRQDRPIPHEWMDDLTPLQQYAKTMSNTNIPDINNIGLDNITDISTTKPNLIDDWMIDDANYLGNLSIEDWNRLLYHEVSQDPNLVIPPYVTKQQVKEVLPILEQRRNIPTRRGQSISHRWDKQIANNLYYQMLYELGEWKPKDGKRPMFKELGGNGYVAGNVVPEVLYEIHQPFPTDKPVTPELISEYQQRFKDFITNRFTIKPKQYETVIMTPQMYDDTDENDIFEQWDRQGLYDDIDDTDDMIEEKVTNLPSSEVSSKQVLDDIDEAIGVVSDNTYTFIPTKSIDDTVINQLIDKYTMTPKKIAMVAIPSVLGAYLLSRDNNKQSNQQYRY